MFLFCRILEQNVHISRKKPSATRRKPEAKPLPGRSTPAAAVKPSVTSHGAAVRAPPAPPSRAPAPPPPPASGPNVELYRATFAFSGEDGEISLEKDDIVELVEKGDNGWWLVKKNGQENWAPYNYLELIPPKQKPAAAPPPPPPPPASRQAPSAPTPSSGRPSVPKAPPAPSMPTASAGQFLPPKAPIAKSISADASAKPVAVFPGMGLTNGSATPWKKAPAAENSTNGSQSIQPSVSTASKPQPPVATKPKPAMPPVAAKPGAPKVPGKPPVPISARPAVAPAMPPRPGKGNGVGAAPGQLDLAAAVSVYTDIMFSYTIH
jgi:myosin I